MGTCDDDLFLRTITDRSWIKAKLCHSFGASGSRHPRRGDRALGKYRDRSVWGISTDPDDRHPPKIYDYRPRSLSSK